MTSQLSTITPLQASRYAAAYFTRNARCCSVIAVSPSSEGGGALDVSLSVYWPASHHAPAYRATETMTCWLEAGQPYGEF